MKYVLDTNVVSALMRGDAQVIARLRRLPKMDVSLPQPVLAEIEFGLARLSASRRKARLTERFHFIRDELGRTAWTDDVSAAFGRIKALLFRKGQPIEDLDIAVAAHALATDATLVTANLAHMLRVPGLRIEDWTKEESL